MIPTTFPLSASKVDTFLGCRRLFKYRYLAAPPIVVPKSKHFVIGNIAHKTLELFHQRVLKSNVALDYWGKTLGSAFRDAYAQEQVPQHLADGLLEKADLLTIKAMLKNYYGWYARVKRKDRIYSLEKYFQFSRDGIAISGKADRVDINDKACSIVDYKTNKQPYTLKDVNESVQLQTYALWIRATLPQMNRKPIRGKYLFLRHLPAPRGIRTFEVSDEMMDAAWDKYRAVHKYLTDGCDFRRNSVYKYCLSCEFRNHCFTDTNNGLRPEEITHGLQKDGRRPGS